MRLLLVVILVVSHSVVFGQNDQDLRTYVDYFPNYDIRIKSTGFIVSNAILENERDLPISAGNVVKVGDLVRLKLVIDHGWKTKNDRVFIGAKEVIRLDDGTEILRSEDLFSELDAEGVTATDAEILTLSAQITELRDKKRYAIVSFQVWDKNSDAHLSGHFPLYFQGTEPAKKRLAKPKP